MKYLKRLWIALILGTLTLVMVVQGITSDIFRGEQDYLGWNPFKWKW